MIYLCSPYSHPIIRVRQERFELACMAIAEMLRGGLSAFSPIVNSHPVATICDLPKGFDFWQRIDFEFLNLCSEVWVLMIDGWDNSAGVKAEIKAATAKGMRVLFVDPGYLGIQ